MPSQSRNAGGVVGSLIASTGNLVGIAAPVHSQLQPNVKRPGYRLSRWAASDCLIDFLLNSSVRYSHKEELVRPPPARLPSFYSANSDQIENGRSTPTSLYQGIRSLPSTMLGSLSLKGARRSGASTPHEFRPFSDRGGGYHRRQVRSEKNKHKRRKAEVFVSKNYIDSRSVNCRSLDYSACCPGDSTGGIHS